MEWVDAFYRRQHAWSDAYRFPIGDYQRAQAYRIGVVSGKLKARVLELGAGAGQTAAAIADAGHQVTAVELVDTLADEIASRAVDRPNLQVARGDFYTLPLEGPYDVVGYWDGFGIGSDADQRRLLRRIAAWLAPDGCALIDVFTPWYWAAAAGRQMRLGDARRRYDFDADGCRMLDTWWHADAPEETVTQSLRCYSPADLRLLLQDSGLVLVDVEPGGAVDEGTFLPRVPLARAMSYSATLRPVP